MKVVNKDVIKIKRESEQDLYDQMFLKRELRTQNLLKERQAKSLEI